MTDHRKRPRDPNQLGKLIIDIATGQVEDRPPTPEERGKKRIAAKQGRIGGKTRAERLSAVKRKEIAKVAAEARHSGPTNEMANRLS
jgi:hypothetical protein